MIPKNHINPVYSQDFINFFSIEHLLLKVQFLIKNFIKKNTIIKNIIIMLMIFLLSSIFAFSISLQAGEAADFYESSNVRFYYEEGNFYLNLTTPAPVLCAVNFAEMGEKYNNLTAMDMISPGVNHLVELDLEPDKIYQVKLTAFTEAHEIYRSQEYLVDTGIDNETDDLIVIQEGEKSEECEKGEQDQEVQEVQEGQEGQKGQEGQEGEEGQEVQEGQEDQEIQESQARTIELAAADDEFSQVPEIEGVTDTGASINFSTKNPTLSSTAFGTTEEFGRLVRAPGRIPAESHEVSLPGLQADTEYSLETIVIDESGKLLRSGISTFTTAESEEEVDYGENHATLEAGAEIYAVSSNFGNDLTGPFGAVNAIDGDPGSEWSSQGEGDEAWIEIKLAESREITGFGFWSRTMGDTGEIRRLKVITGEGEILGEFDIPDAERLYNFTLPPTKTQNVRFEVVNSTGGNTGAREIRIYGEAN